MSDDTALDAGELAAWLHDADAALRDGRTAPVPCGDCTACCTSSQFVHIAPDETATLARIPKALLFPAPGMPRGHVVLGYDTRGQCPMLIDGRCSIYEVRPRTCRTYDCRIFAATGVAQDEPGAAAIARRARRWQFTGAVAAADAERIAAAAAAAFLRAHPALLTDAGIPPTATQVAVVALAIRRSFVATAAPDVAAVEAAINDWATERDAAGPAAAAGRAARSAVPPRRRPRRVTECS